MDTTHRVFWTACNGEVRQTITTGRKLRAVLNGITSRGGTLNFIR